MAVFHVVRSPATSPVPFASQGVHSTSAPTSPRPPSVVPVRLDTPIGSRPATAHAPMEQRHRVPIRRGVQVQRVEFEVRVRDVDLLLQVERIGAGLVVGRRLIAARRRTDPARLHGAARARMSSDGCDMAAHPAINSTGRALCAPGPSGVRYVARTEGLPRPELCTRTCSAAAARRAAVGALVARAAAHHDRAARRARRRVFLVLHRRELGVALAAGGRRRDGGRHGRVGRRLDRTPALGSGMFTPAR